MFEGSEDCARELRKRLNSPEYAYLKTTDERL